MIAFGAVIEDVGFHRRVVEPGIAVAAQGEPELLAVAPVEPIQRAYNLILDEAARRDDLEALLLVHPSCELGDPRLIDKVRAALADPDVAVVGAAGARGVTGLAWWQGEVVAGPVVQRYPEHGGGLTGAYDWADPAPAPGEVDATDDLLLGLSPWAVRHLRFDEGLGGYGWDVDLGLQARAAGKKVLALDITATRHGSLDLIASADRWIASHQLLAEKWFLQETDEAGWRERARRAEAEREAARIDGAFLVLRRNARIELLEERLRTAQDSLGWRLTRPLRTVNRLLGRS